MKLDKEVKIEFQSLEEFLSWKSAEEQLTTSSWVKYTSSKCTSAGKKSYYVCHRSGEYSSKSAGIRTLKAQGSNRISGTCPSTINVLERKDGKVEVIYLKTHHGHSFSLHDMGKMRLTDGERKIIAGKLKEGVTVTRILHDIRDSITGKNVEFRRIHLITRQDIVNVQRGFGIGREEQLHAIDSTSVNLWVSKMQSEGNTVLLFKQQGQDDPKGILSRDDFVLVIMTPAQKDMLVKYGMNSYICVDSTHGTTGYDFQLTTVLVVDEFCAGFPVAFCFSTKIDYSTMFQFFSVLKRVLGVSMLTYSCRMMHQHILMPGLL